MFPGICTGDERNIVLLSPSCPEPLLPHDHRVPSVLVANEKTLPPLIALHVVPGICTGDDAYVVLLCPSCPLILRPHDHRVLSVFFANEP